MISGVNLAIAAAFAGLVLFAMMYWLLRRPARKRSGLSDRPRDDLEVLAGELAELVDVARFINNGFQDDNFYAIRSKYTVIARCLLQHPVYSRYIDSNLGATIEGGHALPLSMLRQEDKECLLVTLRELQGCVQILINLRDAGCIPGTVPGADGDRPGDVPLLAVPAARPVRNRGLRAAMAAAALVVLAGATVLLSGDEAAVSVETLLAQAGRTLRGPGIGVEAPGQGSVRPAASGEGEAEGRDLAARSRRLGAEMEALDRAVLQRRDELHLVGASVARLRLAAEAGQERRREAEAAKASADAAAAEARAGIEAASREAAALRAQVAGQRETLDAAQTEVDAARSDLTALRAAITEQAGRLDAVRAEGEAEIRQVGDRLSELGRTAQDNHEAIGRIGVTLVGFEETSRSIEAARDQLSRERTHLTDLASDASEAGRTLSEIKTRIAALKVALAGPGSTEPAAPAATVPAPPLRTEAALQPEEWRRIQQALARSGHYAGKTDGRPGEETRAAIAKYQRGIGAEPTGRLSPAQIERLIPPPPAKQPMAAR